MNNIKEQARRWIHYSNSFSFQRIEEKLTHITKQLKGIRPEKELNEISLDDLKQRSEILQKTLNQSTNVSIKQQSASFINKI